MYNKEEVEDSLEFCRDIQIYYEAEKHSPYYDYTRVSVPRKRDVFRNSEYAYQTIESIARDQVTGAATVTKMWILRDLINFLICIAVAFGAALFITTFIAHHTKVEGASMEPTLAEDDYLIIEKMSYRFHEPERYDIVVFPVAFDADVNGTYYIKRIIGLPGETVQIMNGEVYIDGDLLGEDYGMAEILDPGISKEPIILNTDEYFVLGDNRNFSTDSRSANIGPVHAEDIIGKAFMRIYPFNKFGSISD